MGRGFGKGAQRRLILVYVYMPRGTLYDHLHKVTDTPLSWIQRLKIAIGAGRGLDYLHTGFGTQNGVIHRDVKSSNILLDENLAAMISDFGLSKIGPIDQTAYNVSVSVKGTFGYLDPEYFYTSKLTRKTDVYAFGFVLFELLSGSLPLGRTGLGKNHGVCNGFAGTTGEMRQFCIFARHIGIYLDDSVQLNAGWHRFPQWSNENHMNQGSQSDLKMLKEFRHPNLVKVIGYYKGETNELLYWLLPLATKVKVAVGIARGILYLCNTTNNAGKLSCFSRYSGLWDWDKTICTFKLNNYMILLDEDFTAKILEYDIRQLVEDYDYCKIERDLPYRITGLVDGDYYPGFSHITLQTKIFSGFRSVFTEVLTGRNFSLEKFHKIDHSLRKHGKESLGLVAKLCYENCNNIDSEQMVLKYFEEYENYIHMGSRHL
ncbi:receptor-like protein kinase FERONIA [Tanacetum coccineum]